MESILYPMPPLETGERVIASVPYSKVIAGSGGSAQISKPTMLRVVDRWPSRETENAADRFALIESWSAACINSSNNHHVTVQEYQSGLTAILAAGQIILDTMNSQIGDQKQYTIADALDKLTLFDRYLHTDQDLHEVLVNITFNNSVLDLKYEYEMAPGRIGDTEGWGVSVTFERPDTCTGEIGRGRGRDWFIPKGQTESYVFFTIHSAIEFIIRHEHLEGEHFYGHRPLFPHNSVHRLNDLSKHIASDGVKAWIRPGD